VGKNGTSQILYALQVKEDCSGVMFEGAEGPGNWAKESKVAPWRLCTLARRPGRRKEEGEESIENSNLY